jgi:histidyl-tRNA synthetase
MRDHVPAALRRRRYVFSIIEDVFQLFGFEPLETPAVERLEVLQGKYGAETEKLGFKILKRGAGAETGQCDMGLRYDLTVPLARFIASHPELAMPFRRYQIAPVWRAERPQRGRFREFYQCDIDTVGSASLVADAECVVVADLALKALGFEDYDVIVNHRQLLRAIAAAAGVADREHELLIAIDKLDKIGPQGVSAELEGRGFGAEAVALLWSVLEPASAEETAEEAMERLERSLPAPGPAAIADLRQLLEHVDALGGDLERVRFDPVLARGADYYTGPVFEIQLHGGGMGSLGGGGRYDGLIGHLGGRDLPAVGVSLGIERILVLMEEREMFPTLSGVAEVFVAALSDDVLNHALNVSGLFRAAGVSTVVSDVALRPKKVFKQAERMGTDLVVMIGTEEVAAGEVSVKRLSDGEQWRLPVADAVQVLIQD